MKNLITALFITLASFTVKAQEQFNGIWANSGSGYMKTILASEYSVIQVYNTSFDECRVINEKIVPGNDTTFVTELYNKANGYKVNIKYTLKDADTIEIVLSGSLNRTDTLTRLY
jgi:hypothetical protein